MPESESVAEARRRVAASLSVTRAGLATLSNDLDGIRSDPRLSDEGKGQAVAHALAQRGAELRGAMEDARESAVFTRRGFEGRLSRLGEVSPRVVDKVTTP